MSEIRTSVKKRTYGKKLPKAGPYSRSAMVSAARGAARSASTIARGEFKCVDTSSTNGSYNQTGALILLNGIAPGTGLNQRSGREVVMKSIEVHFNGKSTDTTGVPASYRCMLVYDRQCNGAAPALADIIATTGAWNTLSPRNLDNRRRFKILMDRVFTVGAQGDTTTAAGCSSRFCDKFYRRLNHPIVFNSGVAGTIADIQTGSLYWITLGDLAAGVTDGEGSVYARVRYLDR